MVAEEGGGEVHRKGLLIVPAIRRGREGGREELEKEPSLMELVKYTDGLVTCSSRQAQLTVTKATWLNSRGFHFELSLEIEFLLLVCSSQLCHFK